jgi:hypothetical protein
VVEPEHDVGHQHDDCHLHQHLTSHPLRHVVSKFTCTPPTQKAAFNLPSIIYIPSSETLMSKCLGGFALVMRSYILSCLILTLLNYQLLFPLGHM